MRGIYSMEIASGYWLQRKFPAALKNYDPTLKGVKTTTAGTL